MRPPHRLEVGKRRLRKFVAKAEVGSSKLPCVHTTDAYNFADIIANGNLQPSQCPVFHPERLIYLFYGRPSFRPNIDEDPLSLSHYYPVCLIFRPDIEIPFRRVFPFDSGAFHSGLYRSHVHKNMILGDFLLENKIETPEQIIEIFFGSSDQYMKGKPLPELSADPSEFEVHTLSSIFSAKNSNILDSRSSSIEIQTDTAIDIASNLLCAILPEPFERTELGTWLKEKKIDVVPYPVMGRGKPIEYMGCIHQAIMSYFEKSDFLRP